MKSLCNKMPDGYLESIQKGLTAVRCFSRHMSIGTGTKEENIARLKLCTMPQRASAARQTALVYWLSRSL